MTKEQEALFEEAKRNNAGGMSGYDKSQSELHDMIEIVPVDISEIQQYLPEGHVDKIKENKIPEYVECIKNESKYEGLEKGKVYKTVKVERDYLYVINDKGVEISVYFGLNHTHKQSRCTYFEPSTKEAFDDQNKPKEISYVGRWIYDYYKDKYFKIKDHYDTGLIYVEGSSDSYDLHNVGQPTNFEGKLPKLMSEDFQGPASKPKEIEMRKQYHLSELKYPIAIHITSREEHEKLNKLQKGLLDYYNNESNYYLCGQNGKRTGPYSGTNYRGEEYINVEFSDIIFPVEERKYVGEAVHCTNSEQWEFVRTKLPVSVSYQGAKDSYGYSDCINLDNKDNFGHHNYYLNKNYKVYSFDEWCTKFGYKPETKSNTVCGVSLIPGEYYYLTQSNLEKWIIKFKGLNGKDNEHILASSVAFKNIKCYYPSDNWGDISQVKSIRLATPEEKAHFEACEKAGKYVEPSKDKEFLIKEAKRRYPVGTSFVSFAPDRQVKKVKGQNFIVDKGDILLESDSIINSTDSKWSIYKQGKWAEIVQDEKWVPKVGDWVLGWHYKGPDNKYSRGEAWQIYEIFRNLGITYIRPEPNYSTDIDNIRKAEPHEIPSYPGTDKGTITVTLKQEDIPIHSMYSVGYDPYITKHPLTPDECSIIKPIIQVNAEVLELKIKTSVPVTLKPSQDEVKIKVNQQKTIKI